MIIYYIQAIIATVIYGIATIIALVGLVIGMIARDTARIGLWFDPDRSRKIDDDNNDCS